MRACEKCGVSIEGYHGLKRYCDTCRKILDKESECWIHKGSHGYSSIDKGYVMTHREILELRKKIETDPILTDEEIEFIWNAIDRQTAEKPIKGSINPDKTQQYKCPICGRLWWEWNFIPEYCGSCGQRIDLSDRDFANTMDEIMAHIGIDMSTKSDFTSYDIAPNAFVGFLGKTEDGKVELAKKEIVKAFDINKSMKEGKR